MDANQFYQRYGYYKEPEVRVANDLNNSSIYFASTVNSRVGVASPEGRHIESASHYSFNDTYPMHYNSENYMQGPIAHNMHASDSANSIQHVNHYASVEQSRVPMYNHQGQTSIASSAVQYETSHAANSYNVHGEVSPCYSSAINSQYVNPSGGMPMRERIGHANTSTSANYSQASYNSQYGSNIHNSAHATASPSCINEIPQPYSMPNSRDPASYGVQYTSRSNEYSAPQVAANYHNSVSHATPSSSRTNEISAPYTTPNSHNSASHNVHDASRNNGGLAGYPEDLASIRESMRRLQAFVAEYPEAVKRELKAAARSTSDCPAAITGLCDASDFLAPPAVLSGLRPTMPEDLGQGIGGASIVVEPSEVTISRVDGNSASYVPSSVQELVSYAIANASRNSAIRAREWKLKAAKALTQAASQGEVQTSDCPVATIGSSDAPNCPVHIPDCSALRCLQVLVVM